MGKLSLEAPPEPFTPREKVIIEVSKAFFWFFLEHVFLKSFEGDSFEDDSGVYKEFSFGRLHMEWALLAQFNPRLCVMAPRAHLKSTVLALGYAFWQMFRVGKGRITDILYFSYKEKLATEQVQLLLRFIKVNPYTRFWHNQKPSGITTIDYLVDFGDGVIGEGIMQGEGIKAATRGRHPKVTICDDILSDFTNPLSSADLALIGKIFRQSIMSLPANPTDPLIVVGTPQSFDDALYQLSNAEGWMWLMYPAIVDENLRMVQWPEKFTYERLGKLRRQLGDSAFEVEFQLSPLSLADQFFSKAEVLSVTDPQLGMWPDWKPFPKEDLSVYAGVDIGYAVHPSHISVFVELPNGTLVQVYQRFLDGMKYPDQVELLNKIAKTFKITRGYYDATTNTMEDRDLSPVWRGRRFTKQYKGNLATLFAKRVFASEDEPGIILLNDSRQLEQITIVDKKLDAQSTVNGHGDSFWSNSLAIKAADDGPGIIDMGTNFNMLQRSYGPHQTWARQLSR